MVGYEKYLWPQMSGVWVGDILAKNILTNEGIPIISLMKEGKDLPNLVKWKKYMNSNIYLFIWLVILIDKVIDKSIPFYSEGKINRLPREKFVTKIFTGKERLIDGMGNLGLL